MKQKLSVSLVIPVYNDAESLLACLRNIERLDDRPDEVIVVNVVDGAPGDASGEVAGSFSFVRIVSENRRGVIHARTTGFNAAKGDIIARIDADTILEPGWVSKVRDEFNTQPDLAAISGSMIYYDFYLKKFGHLVDKTARRFMAKHMKDHIFLNGSNMAIRRSAWRQVKANLCDCLGTHEDLDLAIHLQEQGLRVIYKEELKAGISARRLASGFRRFAKYCLVSPKTYAKHHLWCRVYMYPVILVLWSLFLPAHLIFLSYDAESDSLSLKTFLSNRLRQVRVDPYVSPA